MKNLIQTVFFLLFTNICVSANANTVAPSGAKSDTIKPRKAMIREPQMPKTPLPAAEMDGADQKINRDVKQVTQKQIEQVAQKTVEPIKEIPKPAGDSISPKAARKAAAAAKKAEEKRLKEEKEKKDPPKVHLFAWLSLGLGIVAIAGLIGYFVLPVYGLGAIAAIGAGIFGYLATKKIKKEPLKWKGLPFTTFGGMSILALLAVIVVWLVSFFRANSGI
jgi:ribosomal protein L12E/L44/L45/RPP1/RPP2